MHCKMIREILIASLMVIIHGMEGAVDVCLSNGICNCRHPPPVFRVPNPSFCKEIICEDPGVPVNGYKTNAKQVYHLNDTVYFHCNEGYRMNGRMVNFCTQSGEWAHPVPVCGESTTTQDTTTISTTEPTTSHPTTTILTSTTQDTTTISTTEPTTSHPTTTTLATSTTQDTATMSTTEPTTSHPTTTVTTLATSTTQDATTMSTTEPTTSHPTTTTLATSTTQDTTTMSTSDPTTSHPTTATLPCPAEEVSHGRLIYTTPGGVIKHDNPLHGDTRRLRCRLGYKSRSFSKSRCDNGVWVGGSRDIQCHPKPCDPIRGTMGLVNYTRTAEQNGKYIHGTEVTVNCDSEYVPAFGNGTSVCNASRWWKVIPTCTQSRNKLLDPHTQASQTPTKNQYNRPVVNNAWLARDGNTDSAPQFCSRTPLTYHPWWKAVMKNIYNFTLVKIYNRLDREDHRFDLVDAEIRVGVDEDYTTNLLCGEPVTRRQIENSTEANHGITIICEREGITGIRGNVISVHIPNINERRELSLCEVEVYQQGEPIPARSCKAPVLPDHMTPLRSRFPHGTILNVSCEHGFELRTNRELPICHEGGWSRPLAATCQRDCGGTFTENSGMFSSPSDDGSVYISVYRRYPHGVNCIYNIAIDPGMIIELTFNAFSLETHISCLSDYVEIYDNGTTPNVTFLGRYCGSTPPPVMMSASNRMSVVFSSDSPVAAAGFTASYVAVNSSPLRTCPWLGYILDVVQYVNGLETNKLATYPHDELPEGTFLVSRCTSPGEYVLRGSANRTCSDGSWTGKQPSCVHADTRIVFKDYRPLEFRSNGTIVIQPRSQLIIYCHVSSNEVAGFESENGPDAVYWESYGPSTMVMSLSPPLTSHSGWFTCRSANSSLSHTVYVQFAGN